MRPRYWSSITESPTTRAFLLVGLGLLAFFLNLHLSLFEGSEGLYAHIAHDMLRAEQYFQLTYVGEPYTNKTPLFFWMLAMSTTLFGENEIALRLPAVLFSVGTMALVYWFGQMLFSPRAGFWAAVTVATNLVYLWYGRRVLFDSSITFFITLALFAWIRARHEPIRPAWYVVCFSAMALATMIKGLHGVALPALVLTAYSMVMKDAQPLREKWFWAGLACFTVLTGWYSTVISNGSGYHFDPTAQLWNIINWMSFQATLFGDEAVYWYAYMIWFDFFPWCVVMVPGLALLFSRRPFRDHPSELFLLLWALGFFLAISLAPYKREPYLMVLVPALSLVIGYYYHSVLSSAEPRQWATSLSRAMLGLLAVAFGAALFVGPALLQRKWGTPLSLFPALYTLPMLAFCSMLLYAVFRGRMGLALRTAGALAVGFAVGVVHLILPAIDDVASPKQFSEHVRAFAASFAEPVFVYNPRWPDNEDAVYYMSLDPTVRSLRSEDALAASLEEAGDLLLVTDRTGLSSLRRMPDLAVKVVREFPQRIRKLGLYVVAIRKEDTPQAGHLSSREMITKESLRRAAKTLGAPAPAYQPTRCSQETLEEFSPAAKNHRMAAGSSEAWYGGPNGI